MQRTVRRANGALGPLEPVLVGQDEEVTGRTLVITNDFPPRSGGIQSFVHGLLLRQDPDSVVVYAPKWKRAAEFDAEQSFPVIRHPRSLMVPEPTVLRRAREIAKTYDCDRVLFGAAAPLGLLAPALRKSGLERSVAITHGHEAGWAKMPGTRQLLRRIGQGVDTITYLGEYTRERIADALTPEAAARMRRLVPGVDDELFNPRNKSDGDAVRAELGLADRPVVVCVSRLMPRKGQDTLIRAMPAIKQKIPGAALLIVGGGPYRGHLEGLVKSERLDDDVVITGGVPFAVLPAHYAAGDVFAMPCRTRNHGFDVEGLGIVYLEAAATGMAAIAGNSGGAPDAVIPGETGFVVDGDSIGESANAVTKLLGERDLAAQFGNAGRQWVESNWRWPHVAARLTMLLDGQDPDAV